MSVLLLKGKNQVGPAPKVTISNCDSLVIGNTGVTSFSPSSLAQTQFWGADNSTSRIVDGKSRLTDKSRTGTPRQLQPGRCFDFAGVGDEIDLGQSFNPGTSDFSLSVWVYVDAVTGLDGLITKNAGSGGNRWGLYTTDSNAALVFCNPDGAGDLIVTGSTNIAGGWHNVAAVFNRDGDLELFVDGTSEGVLDISTKIASTLSNAVNLYVGRDGASRHLNGKMMDARIYSRALSNTEITRIAGMQVGGDIGPTDPVVWLKCDEGSGTTAYDSSGNGNNGTITAVSISTFHDATANDVYSFQNEVGHGLGDLITSTTTDAWGNSGFSSSESIPASTDGHLEFMATETDKRRMIGLSDGDDNQTYTSVNYQFYLYDNGELRGFEGVSQVFTSEVFAPGDILRIERVGTTITFKKNGGLIYTSLTASSSELFVDASMYNMGSTIQSLSLTYGGNRIRPTITNLIGATHEEILVPRGESDTDNDVLGITLVNTGQCPHDPIINSPCGTFDGVGDYVRLTTSLVHPTVFKHKFTIKTTGDGAVYVRGASTGGMIIAVGEAAWLGGTAKKLNVWFHSGGTLSSTTDVDDGAWHEIEVERNSSNLVTITIDGVLDASYTNSVVLSGSFDSDLGGSGVYPGRFLDCTLFDYEITENGVSKLYLRFCESSGTTIYDVSGNSNNGTLTTASESAFWVNTQNIKDTLVLNGYRRSGSVNIPALTSGASAADGNALTHGPGVLAPGQSLDLSGGEPNSPYALQLDAIISDLTYQQGDDDESNSVFARSTASGDDRVVVTLPALTGSELTDMQGYTA